MVVNVGEIKLKSAFDTSLKFIGKEQFPLVIIDELVEKPQYLINCATKAEVDPRQQFMKQPDDYYPGIRKLVPSQYCDLLCQLRPLLTTSFKLNDTAKADVIMSAFSLTTTPIEKLRPIQMLPHFDTPYENQFAMVHYLCNKKHGGTGFYRHRVSGFESISTDRLSCYKEQIKQQAMNEKVHIQPRYIQGNTSLFERIYSVEAKMNRAIIYPSNVLHSGNIKSAESLSTDPLQGRLTINSFFTIN